MSITTHMAEFAGFRIRDFDPDDGIRNPDELAPRVRVYYTPVERLTPEQRSERARKLLLHATLALIGALFFWFTLAWWGGVLFLVLSVFLVSAISHRPQIETTVQDQLDAIAADPKADRLRALVVGAWHSENDVEADFVVEHLLEVADRLPSLEALFVGDITGEECEISWLQQTDLAPLLDAFPNLRVLGARGGNGLRFRDATDASLEELVFETGGMDTRTIEDVCGATLPGLKKLELWLGDPTYGFEASVDDLRELWSPSTFPALETLALRNAPIADEIAIALHGEPDAVARLKRLDLSLGTLSDVGAKALFETPAVAELEELDLHHHYLSDYWSERLASLDVDVDLSDPRGAIDPEEEAQYDDVLRFVAVSE